MRFITALAAITIAACSASTNGTNKPPLPACASTFAGAWTLTATRTDKPGAYTPCADLKKNYTFTISVDTNAQTLTETDEDGASATYEVKSVECNNAPSLHAERVDHKDDVKVSGIHDLNVPLNSDGSLTDGSHLNGILQYGRTNANNETICGAVFSTKLVRP